MPQETETTQAFYFQFCVTQLHFEIENGAGFEFFGVMKRV